MAFYFASDIHLRLDRPDRGERFSRWVDERAPDDALMIVGDLCDFWMGSRLPRSRLMECDGLSALARFRDRGGSLTIMAGNHDLWLCPFYQRTLGASLIVEPHEQTIHGIRLHVVHGHLLGARKKWKSWLESRPFFDAFGKVPTPLAGVLDQVLERKNQGDLLKDEERHLAVFRQYADSVRGRADLVIIGHVHRAVDDRGSDPRMIVLGGWQRRGSYLKIDAERATFHLAAPELDADPSPAMSRGNVSGSEPRYPNS